MIVNVRTSSGKPRPGNPTWEHQQPPGFLKPPTGASDDLPGTFFPPPHTPRRGEIAAPSPRNSPEKRSSRTAPDWVAPRRKVPAIVRRLTQARRTLPATVMFCGRRSGAKATARKDSLATPSAPKLHGPNGLGLPPLGRPRRRRSLCVPKVGLRGAGTVRRLAPRRDSSLRREGLVVSRRSLSSPRHGQLRARLFPKASIQELPKVVAPGNKPRASLSGKAPRPPVGRRSASCPFSFRGSSSAGFYFPLAVARSVSPAPCWTPGMLRAGEEPWVCLGLSLFDCLPSLSPLSSSCGGRQPSERQFYWLPGLRLPRRLTNQRTLPPRQKKTPTLGGDDDRLE